MATAIKLPEPITRIAVAQSSAGTRALVIDTSDTNAKAWVDAQAPLFGKFLVMSHTLIVSATYDLETVANFFNDAGFMGDLPEVVVSY